MFFCARRRIIIVSEHRMPSVIAWFSPNDTLLVDRAAVLRIVDYSEASATLEVRATEQAQPITLAIDSRWSKVIGALEVRYRGIFVNEKCQPARQAGIEFRDTDVVDIRPHSFAGVPVRDGPRI